MADDSEKRIIEIEYVVKVDDAITKTEEFEDRVRETIAQLQEAAQKSKLSIDSLAKGMAKSFEEQQKTSISELQAKIASIKTSDATPVSKSTQIKAAQDEINQRTKAIQEYKRVVAEALARVVEAEKAAANTIRAVDKETLEQKEANLKEYNKAFDEYVKSLKTKEALTPAAQSVKQEITNLKAEITALASQTGKSFTQISQEMLNKGQKPAKLVKQAVSELNAEMKGVASSGGGGFLGFLKSLGTVGQIAFGYTLGTLAIQALRSITNFFKEAAQAGFEYAQALARLKISTNILQEKGYNITLRETLELVTALNKEFPLFTRKAVVEGVGYIQLLSQNLGLGNDQMKNMAEVASALGVVLGKDVGEAAKELALFLSSGYGEALQRAGILASKQAVADELVAMGIKTKYNETDQATRAQAGYNVIMRDAIKLLEKAKEIQKGDEYAATRLSAAWTELKNIIGIRMTPALADLYDGLTAIINGKYGIKQLITWLREASATFQTMTSSAIPALARAFQFWGEVMQNVLNPKFDFKKALAEYFTDVQRIWNENLFKFKQFNLPDIYGGMKDSAIGAGTALEDANDTIEKATDELYTNISEAEKQFTEDSLDLWKDYNRDLEQLTIDHLRREGESWLQYFAEQAAIWRKSYDDIVGENIKFQLDLEQINREYTQKRADAEQKYRDKEAKAERDFQEKLRRLREEFLFDLEDALRERDARQVLRLIRRFNLEQERLNRERAAEREDSQLAYRRELEDIDRQKAERLQKLNEEHQARLAEIRRQEAIELRELEIKHNAEMAEIDRRLQQERDDRTTRWEQQQSDLKDQFNARVKEIIANLVTEYSLTAPMLEAIGAAYTKIYGPNGVIQGALASYIAYLGVVQASIAALNSAWQPGAFSGSEPKGYPFYSPPINSGPRATGAKNWAVTSPRTMTVGEVPEMVNITPLNRLSSSDMGSKDGTITVELLLSPDLQARVIDNTMTEVANVMLDIQRRR